MILVQMWIGLDAKIGLLDAYFQFRYETEDSVSTQYSSQFTGIKR